MYIMHGASNHNAGRWLDGFREHRIVVLLEEPSRVFHGVQ